MTNAWHYARIVLDKHGGQMMETTHAEFENLVELPTVLLSEAETVYSPVGGTSGGSVYFMVAAAEEFNVAVRYRGQSLSIRAERRPDTDPENEEWLRFVARAGLKLHGESHASIHIAGLTEVTATALVAGLLASCGVEWKTEFPKFLSELMGRGQ